MYFLFLYACLCERKREKHTERNRKGEWRKWGEGKELEREGLRLEEEDLLASEVDGEGSGWGLSLKETE